MNSEKKDLVQPWSLLLILLLHLWEFVWEPVFQSQVWKGCLQKAILTDELTGACIPQVASEDGDAWQLARQTTGKDNAPTKMGYRGCRNPLAGGWAKWAGYEKLPKLTEEAVGHGRQQCEQPACVAARTVGGWLGFVDGSGELHEKQPDST